MAAITNWKSVGESAVEGDKARAQIALQAQAQNDAQKRWEAEQAEKKRIREEENQWSEKVYADSRNDLNYNRGFERDKFNTQRGDVDYNRNFEREKWDTQRGDVGYNRAFEREKWDTQNAFEREKYDNKLYQDDFDNELKLDKHNQATALFDNQMAEYNRITADREAKEQASKTSLAALLAYGIRNGDRDEQGRIFIPTDAINLFNKSLAKAMGANRAEYTGAVLITKNPDGTPLNGMQVALLKKDGSVDVVPQNELIGLVDTFRELKGEYDGLMGQLFPQQQEKPKQAFDKTYYTFINDSLKDISKELAAERKNVDEDKNEKNPTAINKLMLRHKVFSFMREHHMQTGEKLEYDDAFRLYRRKIEEAIKRDIGGVGSAEEFVPIDGDLILNQEEQKQ